MMREQLKNELESLLESYIRDYSDTTGETLRTIALASIALTLLDDQQDTTNGGATTTTTIRKPIVTKRQNAHKPSNHAGLMG